jgi:apolipoprotein N-acyltransferase
VGSAALYGFVRIHTARFRPGPRVALLQSNFKQELKSSLEPEQIIGVYRDLMVRAEREHADLIVWPETAFPYYGTEIVPGVPDSTVERLARRLEPKVTAADVRRRQQIVGEMLHGISDWARVPVVFGLTVVEFGPDRRTKYNSSVLVEPRSANRQRYDKLHLVPFGEYVPLLETFPWLTRLTPYHGETVPSLSPGTTPAWLRLRGWKFASAICFEDSLPFVVRRSFAEVTDGHAPDVILNISNDGWFRGSAELDMHLAVSVFRAVENRVPLARAVNTGISAIIDGNGAILARLPKLSAGTLVGVVPLDDRDSLYVHAGEWLGQLCLIATILLFFLSLPGVNRWTCASRLPRPT